MLLLMVVVGHGDSLGRRCCLGGRGVRARGLLQPPELQRLGQGHKRRKVLARDADLAGVHKLDREPYEERRRVLEHDGRAGAVAARRVDPAKDAVKVGGAGGEDDAVGRDALVVAEDRHVGEPLLDAELGRDGERLGGVVRPLYVVVAHFDSTNQVLPLWSQHNSLTTHKKKTCPKNDLTFQASPEGLWWPPREHAHAGFGRLRSVRPSIARNFRLSVSQRL